MVRLSKIAEAVFSLALIVGDAVDALPRQGQRATAGSGSDKTTLVPSTTVSSAPQTSGTIVTSLETEGHPTSAPFPTISSQPATQTASTTLSQTASVVHLPALAAVVDPFQPIDVNPPPAQITSRGGHPQPTGNIVASTNPLHTNKFYANLFLGSEGSIALTHPYGLYFNKGSGNANAYGLAVQHIEANQRAYGPQQTKLPGSPVAYYINPLGINSIMFGAAELGSSTVMTIDSLQEFSANANLYPSAGATTSHIQFPLLQGMGFVTGIYTKLQPRIYSGVFFNKIVAAASPAAGVSKWIISLDDGHEWLMYAVSSDGSIPAFTLVSSTMFQGPPGWSGFIQIAKNPASAAGETVFDASAGIYPTSATLSGDVNGNTGSYSITWNTAGSSTSGSILQFALPHHLEAFQPSTASGVQNNIKLQTTTKGVATAVVGNSWTLIESNLPTNMGFAPWSPTSGPVTSLSQTAVSAIYSAAQVELQQDMEAQSNLNSMYYAGKALSKFASIIYAVHDLCNEPGLAQQGLTALETAFSRFTNNVQDYPLVYDTVWKGVVSVASYPDHTNDSGSDFGNTFYNDHHFHYGYFLHAAAIVGYLDPSWTAQNKAWVNALARDVANPSAQDAHFPVFRSFDWYHGHSFAKGLFESGDGKDEESTSEDVMFAYGLKMWGHTAGDASMEARGNLMLAVLARSLRAYFLLEASNANQPAPFIANKVTGIYFDNKVDHTSYFGANLEFVQGIHMVPLEPASALVRTKTFVQEEWDAFFKAGAVDDASNVQGGWKGILWANYALVNPVASFNFFHAPNFDMSWLDGGASLTWYLAFAAGLGGA